jgi:hypothetical protein
VAGNDQGKGIRSTVSPGGENISLSKASYVFIPMISQLRGPRIRLGKQATLTLCLDLSLHSSLGIGVAHYLMV